ARLPEPNPTWTDEALGRRWEQLLEVRSTAQAVLEARRREKVIGASLEARVVIEANPDRYEFLRGYEEDLSSLLIVSQVELKKVTHPPPAPDFTVTVGKAAGRKCERCWNYRESVGQQAAHPTLCDRCVEAIE
ncbi:MAG: zinc finger domain-containing protein, partial [Nitrospirales bacterium]